MKKCGLGPLDDLLAHSKWFLTIHFGKFFTQFAIGKIVIGKTNFFFRKFEFVPQNYASDFRYTRPLWKKSNRKLNWDSALSFLFVGSDVNEKWFLILGSTLMNDSPASKRLVWKLYLRNQFNNFKKKLIRNDCTTIIYFYGLFAISFRKLLFKTVVNLIKVNI